jgi:protein-S-isoprenylcysteine O-methyltransferase Ste14
MKTTLRALLMTFYAVASAAALAAIMCLAAGRWDVPMFWVTSGAMGVLVLVGGLLMDRSLIRERLRPGPGGMDKALIYWGKLLMLATLLIAGWDVGRYHWSDTVPLGLQIVSLVGFSLGIGVMTWAMVVNRFFSSVVRLQKDRGHHLVTSGPYSVVRHPGYAGGVVSVPLFGLAVGSWLAALPMLAFSLLMLRRTVIEDRFLQENLEGYAEYARRVRCRLIPGVW